MKLPKITALLLAGSMALAACGKPSVEGSDKRYKGNKDKLSALAAKQPTTKAELDKKVAEFEAEHAEALKAGSDEEKIKKLGDLNSRMEKYIAELEKTPGGAAGGGATAPSGKLDGAPGSPAATPPAGGNGMGGGAPAGGGKLDGGGAQPASGGMGGGAPAGGSGMGGGAPAGGTAPAQPASGGMGGM